MRVVKLPKSSVLLVLAVISLGFLFYGVNLIQANRQKDVSETGYTGPQVILAKSPNGKKFKLTPTPTPSSVSTPVPTSTSTPTPIVATPTPTQTPISTSTVRFAVVVDDYSNSSGGLNSVQQLLPKPVTMISIFKQFGSQYNSTFIPTDLSYAKSQNMKVQLAWEPWNPNEGMNQSIDYLSGIPRGRFDAYIKDFGNEIKNYGGPVVLRFGHEMNGNWYPWGNRPQEFITAYRYIVDKFRQDGVGNVTWMWSINADNVPYSPISSVGQFYPGSDVVDIIGIDGFNFGTSSYGGWKSFRDIFSSSYNYLTSSYQKPIIISEVASAEIGGDKPAWVANMFSDLKTYFSGISEIVWFNLLKEADWRINSSATTLQSFQNNM